jgi:hypothetical protein
MPPGTGNASQGIVTAITESRRAGTEPGQHGLKVGTLKARPSGLGSLTVLALYFHRSPNPFSISPRRKWSNH